MAGIVSGCTKLGTEATLEIQFVLGTMKIGFTAFLPFQNSEVDMAERACTGSLLIILSPFLTRMFLPL